MNALLTIVYLVLCVGIVIFVPPLVPPFAGEYGSVAVYDMDRALVMCTAVALPAEFLRLQTKELTESFS